MRDKDHIIKDEKCPNCGSHSLHKKGSKIVCCLCEYMREETKEHQHGRL